MTIAFPVESSRSASALKARQVAKIREIGAALSSAGLVNLDQQAIALGLPRSTAWTLLVGSHKSSGLSAGIVVRMLRSSSLPPNVRQIVLQYVQEKASGRYGGKPDNLKRFESRVLAELASERATYLTTQLRESASCLEDAGWQGTARLLIHAADEIEQVKAQISALEGARVVGGNGRS